MLLSEKSGRSYSVKMRLLPLLCLLLALCCLAVFTLLSGAGYMAISRRNAGLRDSVLKLQADLQRLQQENREASLYKQWADAIIYRRFNYEDAAAKGAPPQPRNDPAGDVKNEAASEQSPLDIDEFGVQRVNLDFDFEIYFKLINRSQSGKRLSGYVYIIALNTEVKPEIYAAWPPAEIVSGMPRDFKKGSTFSINYLKHVKGRIEQPDLGPKFNRVDIIAYSEDGNIMLKRGFYIERFLQQSPYE
jgi:hypothetical protein